MYEIPPSTLASIAGGQYAAAILVLFDLPEGLHGFWPGFGTLTVSGVVYIGCRSLLEIEQVNMGVDLSASPLTLRLRSQPEEGLSPDVLAQIDDYAYKNRPARLTLAYFDPATGALAASFLWWQGYIDLIEHDETVGGPYALVARLEPASLDHSRVGYRMRADADQKLIDPDDRFFEHAATTGTEQIPYGRQAGNLKQPGGSAGSPARVPGGSK